MCSVDSVIHGIIHSKLYAKHCTMCSVDCVIRGIVHCKLYTIHCTMCRVDCEICTLQYSAVHRAVTRKYWADTEHEM